ncbi:ABC transporter substrate-binding protein [Streptomyces sp. NPDC020965]|uniref:ABC transporter substrate-binding protein n=1 Tax=Streptomyces sp. NPDC020965 TaxID=3365105 RepID=UPI003790B7F4
MQSIRLRILVICAVVLAAAVGGWQLLPSKDSSKGPISIGTTDAVTSLDPAGAYDVGSWAMFSNIYQSLLTFKPGGVTPVPDAARECAFAGMNLQVYTCRLRDDLTFTNGRKITGADVKFSFDRMLGIKADVGPAPLFPTLKSVTADGQEITFRLSARDATFPQKLATGAGAIVDRERYPAAKLRAGNEVDGSGPYVLKEYESGKRARLEPNPSYKGALNKTGKPIEIRYFKAAEELAAEWQAKRLDLTHRQLPAATIAELDLGSPKLQVTEAQSAESRQLVFNLRSGSPMAEQPVRAAIASIVDRGDIAQSVYHSTVQPLYSMIPKGTLAHSNPFLDEYAEPNVPRARKLLEDADIETPVRFTLAHRAAKGAAAEAANLKGQLEASGLFQVTVVAKEWTVFQQGYAKGEYDAFTLSWLPDFPDPDSFTQPLVGKDSALHNGYRSDTVDRLIARTQQKDVRSHASPDFKAIQREVAKDVPLVPLWQKKDYVLSTRDIGGSQYLTDGTTIWRLWELERL